MMLLLRFDGSGVGDDVEHVVLGELGDYRLHELGPFAGSGPLLHVVELAHEVAGRAAGDAWDRA